MSKAKATQEEEEIVPEVVEEPGQEIIPAKTIPNGVNKGVLTVNGVSYDLKEYGELMYTRTAVGSLLVILRPFTGTGNGKPTELPIVDMFEAQELQTLCNQWWRVNGRG